MTENLEYLYQKLSLIKQEEDVIQIDTQDMLYFTCKTESSLVLKLLTNKPYNKVALWHTMKKVWNLGLPPKFWDMGRHACGTFKL